MKTGGATCAALVTIALGCGHATPPKAVAIAPKNIKLAVLQAESDMFPKAAKAASDALVKAQVKGVDETQISKASLEVVQLSIECVDPTNACYQAAGHTLMANRLLFAQITGAANQVNIAITLFDVDASAAVKTVEKQFASDEQASLGVGDLVTQATKP